MYLNISNMHAMIKSTFYVFAVYFCIVSKTKRSWGYIGYKKNFHNV